MKLRIELNSPVPVYRQIVDGLRILLVDGALKPGDPLPPVRRLAIDLGVHFNTVAEAYRTLAAEGWLVIAGRNGAQVVSRPMPAKPEGQVAGEFERRIRHFLAEAQSRGVPRRQLARKLRDAADALEGI